MTSVPDKAKTPDNVDCDTTEPEEYVLSKEDHAAIDEGIAAADRGEFATDEEVRRLLEKFT